MCYQTINSQISQHGILHAHAYVIYAQLNATTVMALASNLSGGGLLGPNRIGAPKHT